MPRYKVAVVKYGAMELIIAPQDTVFEYKAQDKQLEFRAELQGHAQDAGLIGSVCLIWPYAGGMKFLAPKAAHEYFAMLNMATIMDLVNSELFW